MASRKCGIYCIENNINGKKYIGQSIDISRRWTEHRQKNKANKGTFLYNSIKKHGIENFSFYIIEECEPDKLNEREIYWISYYNTFKFGYNMTLGGSGSLGENVKAQNVLPKNFSKINNGIDDVVKIAKLDNDLNILEIYKSVNDCARKNNTVATNISKTTRQRNKTCNGYTYLKYDDIKDMNKEEIGIYIEKLRSKWVFCDDGLPRKKQVALLDDNNNVIRIFAGVCEAANILNLDDSSISKVCRGRLKTTKGFKFKYVID